MRRRIILKRRIRDVRKLAPVLAGVVIGAGGFFLADRAVENAAMRQSAEAAPAEAVRYFRNCDAARAAGAAPLRRGAPGYNRRLDADGDGVACEPYPR